VQIDTWGTFSRRLNPCYPVCTLVCGVMSGFLSSYLNQRGYHDVFVFERQLHRASDSLCELIVIRGTPENAFKMHSALEKCVRKNPIPHEYPLLTAAFGPLKKK
jgi:hypothetical protein